jgi:integrase
MTKKRRRGRGEGAVFYSESKDAWVGRLPVGRTAKGKTKYKERTAQTKGEVLEKLRAAEDDLRSGCPEAERLTVSDYLDHWLNNVAKPAVQPTTWETYEVNVRVHLKPGLGHVLLPDLRPRHVETFYAKLHKDGVSGGLARKISQVLSAAVRHAARVGLIKSSPTDVIHRPRVPRKEVQPFTPEEVRKILAATGPGPYFPDGNRYAALIALGFATGARLGELLGLAWEHVRLDDATVRVERSLCRLKGGNYRMKEPKSANGRRTVSLPAFAVQALRGHRKRMEAEGNGAAVVFCTQPGHFLDRNTFLQVWRRVLRRAGVPYRKFHNTRHTHASQLLALGVSLVEVARRIGDRPETVLRVYSHYLPADSQVPTKLDGLYGPG